MALAKSLQRLVPIREIGLARPPAEALAGHVAVEAAEAQRMLAHGDLV